MGKVSKAPQISDSPASNSPISSIGSLSNINGKTPSTSSPGSKRSRLSRQSSSQSLLLAKNARPDTKLVFVEKLEKRYECPVCALVLRYPVQFEECGHRCCSSCLPELLRVEPRCPIDQVKVDREKVYVDKAFQHEIDEIAVKCSHHDRGCEWTASLQKLQGHLEECTYVIITCPAECDAEFEKRFLEKHQKEDCPNRMVNCDFCNLIMMYKDEIEHHTTCPKLPIPCPNGCKKKEIRREDLQKHFDQECSKAVVSCPFTETGCTFKGERKEVKKHVKEEPDNHLLMVNASLITFKRAFSSQKQLVEKHTDQLTKMDQRVDTLEKLYGSQIVWKIDNYAEKLAEAKDGKKSTIYSPPFLTGRHGYKMVMSACLFGDGKTRGQYMALFACLCKGDYDALLLWPFGHRLTFTLLDQCQDPSARRNVTYSVKPNTVKQNLSFLGRPTAERNPSFGASRFVDLEVLKTLDYVRDDTLFIKLQVETDDMIML